MAEFGNFPNDLDRGGRYRKVYKDHVNPLTEWRDEHFIKRYRISKERIQQLSREFQPWSRTAGTDVGGGLSYAQQVCNRPTRLDRELIDIKKGDLTLNYYLYFIYYIQPLYMSTWLTI